LSPLREINLKPIYCGAFPGFSAAATRRARSCAFRRRKFSRKASARRFSAAFSALGAAVPPAGIALSLSASDAMAVFHSQIRHHQNF
jgi:hypothetical protein